MEEDKPETPKPTVISFEEFAKIQSEACGLMIQTVVAVVQRVTDVEKRMTESEAVIETALAKEKRHRSI